MFLAAQQRVATVLSPWNAAWVWPACSVPQVASNFEDMKAEIDKLGIKLAKTEGGQYIKPTRDGKSIARSDNLRTKFVYLRWSKFDRVWDKKS